MTNTDPRLARETTRVPRRSDYVKRPVLSATIHPDLKRTLVAMSKRTGMYQRYEHQLVAPISV